MVIEGGCPDCGGHLRPEPDQPQGSKGDGDFRTDTSRQDGAEHNPMVEGFMDDYHSPSLEQTDASFPSMSKRHGEYVTTSRGVSAVDTSNQTVQQPWWVTSEHIQMPAEITQVAAPGPHTVEIDMGRGDPVILQHDDPAVLDDVKTRVEAHYRFAGPLAELAAPAAGMLGRGLMAQGIGGVMKNVLGIGGGSQQQQQQQAPADEGMMNGEIYQAGSRDMPGGGTPGDLRVDTDDPDNVDPHQHKDSPENLNDVGAQGTDEGGASLAGKEIDPNGAGAERFQMLLPLIMHYLQSEEDGSQDPLIKGLHDSLSLEDPDYLGKGSDEHGQKLIMLLNEGGNAKGKDHPLHAGRVAGPIAPTPVGPPSGQNPVGQATCTHCGAVMPPSATTCPQCGAMSGSTRQGANHQGPHSPEQIAAVQQMIIDQSFPDPHTPPPGRVSELPNVPIKPWEYGEEMSQVTQSPSPPTDESTQAPAPAQEETPPGAGMPVPGMSIPPGLSSVRRSSDNMAPNCPDCGSHTTGMLSTDEDENHCVCHTCRHVWPHNDKQVEAAEHRPGDNVMGQPAAEQHQHYDPQHDQAHGEWMDDSGSPLQPGSQYDLYTPGVQIPDLVTVKEIKPGGIVLDFVGQYNLGFSKEISREEFNLEHYHLSPAHAGQSDQQPTDNLGAETNDDDNTGYAGPGPTDLSQPHSVTTSWNVLEASSAAHEAETHLGAAKSAIRARRARVDEMVGEQGTTSLAQIDAMLASGRTVLDEQRTAGAHFSPQEQRALIDEEGEARNRDKLALEGTHYERSGFDDHFLW